MCFGDASKYKHIGDNWRENHQACVRKVTHTLFCNADKSLIIRLMQSRGFCYIVGGKYAVVVHILHTLQNENYAITPLCMLIRA